MIGRLCKTEWSVIKYGHLYVSDIIGKNGDVRSILRTSYYERE